MKRYIKYLTFSTFLILTGWIGRLSAQQDRQGLYFSKISTPSALLPSWSSAKNILPSPVYDEDTLLVATYWKAWELAFKHFHLPSSESGFISPFIDAAFNDNIFLWDTGFMTMFCNYGYPAVPGICSLNNFYIKQHASGEICREIVRKSGKDYQPWVDTENQPLFSRWGFDISNNQLQKENILYVKRTAPTPNPVLTLDGMDHPILAWAEWESYLLTGDKKRLFRIWKPLLKYHEAFDKYLRQGNGLYMTDWASMDNSPRNPLLKSGGTGIDISSEMVLFDLNMADIASETGKLKEAILFKKEAVELSILINKKMWNEKQQFYTDLTIDEKQSNIKTVAGYWTLLAKVASPKQAAVLVSHLKNPATFGTINPVPTLSADEKGFSPSGNYWCGSVWAPTNTMVIRGLENYGYANEAYTIAMKHLHLVAEVYKKTGTIWESYSPDSTTYGLHEDGTPVKKDFVGWSGIGPIMYLIEYAIGIKANAQQNEIYWTIHSSSKTGCSNFRFNHHVVTLMATPMDKQSKKMEIQVQSDGAFKMTVTRNGISSVCYIHSGSNTFIR